MGKIVRDSTGRVHIEDFTFDWNVMDDSMRDWVISTFGPIFAYAAQHEGVTFVYSEETEEVRANRTADDPRFPKPLVLVATKQFVFEVVPWRGHVAEIHVGGNDYTIGVPSLREIPQ